MRPSSPTPSSRSAPEALGEDSDPDRATVNVYADLELLTRDHGVAELHGGHIIDAAVARRLACDSRIATVATTDGRPAAVGTTTHSVPPWLRRLLTRRDNGCRFPGCHHQKWVHAHHVTHWAHGGPTTVDNLVTLCPAHHRLVHEGGWTVQLASDDTVSFTRPDGTPYQPRGPAPP